MYLYTILIIIIGGFLLNEKPIYTRITNFSYNVEINSMSMIQ